MLVHNISIGTYWDTFKLRFIKTDIFDKKLQLQ